MAAPTSLQIGEPNEAPRAIVLVAHGLNLDPSRMDAICRELQRGGALTLRMTLGGHRGDYNELVNISREAWLAGFRTAQQKISEILRREGARASLPVGFLGQSLGALAFTDFVLQGEREAKDAGGYFRGALFLAPAIALRPKSQLIRALRLLPRITPIPSASRPQDRVYSRLPAAAYHALFDTYTSVRRALRAQALRLPLIMTADPKDELISTHGLRSLTTRGLLADARFIPLETDPQARGFRHVAVDEETMGRRNWERFERLINSFLDELASNR